MLKNSFLEQDLALNKILILVPHQDDEVNCAGALMKSCVNAGAKVKVTYLTDGAFKFAAQLRKREALQALRVLGIMKKDVTFLGFPDRNNKKPGLHFYHDRVQHEQVVGVLQKHIKDIKADLIVCVDYDYHCDHRALSLLFEEALDSVLREPDNNYTPLILKAFAYETAFEAPADYWSLNLLSTVRSKISKVETGTIETNNPFFRWDERLRLPVTTSCRTSFLFSNVIFKALCRHLSQEAEKHALQIINADQVFWQKRTDNLAYKAKCSASSGNPQQAINFRLFTTEDILAIPGKICCYGWHPEPQDLQKTVRLQWEQPQIIKQICLFASWEQKETLAAVQITSDKRQVWHFENLHPGKNIINLPLPARVESLQIQIAGTGAAPVLSGLGIFASPVQTWGKPLLKIICDSEFIYDFIVPPGENTCVLELYAANGLKVQGLQVKDTAGQIFVVNFIILAARNAKLCGNRICFQGSSGSIIVRAQVEGRPDIYDEVRVSKKGKIWHKLQKIREKIEKVCASRHFHLRKKYFHIREKYFKDNTDRAQD